MLFPCAGKWQIQYEQEQTKFDDLRRGFTEDFKRLAKFKRTLSKSTKKVTNFKQFAFLAFFDLHKTSKLKFDLICPA